MSFNAKETALRYLSYRSRTVFEVEKHLKEKGFSAEETGSAIEECKGCGYLDDENYCRAYFRLALAKGKGKRKIFFELREKGVDPQTAESAFEDYFAEEAQEYDEREMARTEAEKVLRISGIETGDPVPEKILARIARKLQSKGYGSDVIYSVIGELRR